MWEFFQIITKSGMTPNECLSLFAVHMKITPHYGNNVNALLDKGLIEFDDSKNHYVITADAKDIMTELDNYFLKAKKQTKALNQCKIRIKNNYYYLLRVGAQQENLC